MESSAPPIILFDTIKNTELGAQRIVLNDDGTVSFQGIVKKITESMLVSYPRSALDTWTPNRNAIRYTKEEAAARKVRDFATGEKLDLEGILARAS